MTLNIDLFIYDYYTALQIRKENRNCEKGMFDTVKHRETFCVRQNSMQKKISQGVIHSYYFENSGTIECHFSIIYHILICFFSGFILTQSFYKFRASRFRLQICYSEISHPKNATIVTYTIIITSFQPLYF